MKVLLSIGYGRLHLLQSARYLSAHPDIELTIICGWVPKRVNSLPIKVCSWLIGRDLSFGMAKRIEIPANVRTYSCAGAEFFTNALYVLCRGLTCERSRMAVIGWKLFGWRSRRFLKEADIYHVRSGAGQGGAIQKAKIEGMKVLVDHSMAHPGYIEESLRTIYDAHSEPLLLGSENPFYQLVLKDCMDADILMVNSSFVRDTFEGMGYPVDRIRVVCQGVRGDFFGLRKRNVNHNEGHLKVLFTGTFCFHKGASVILSAIKQLKDRSVEGIVVDVVGSYDLATRWIAKHVKDNLPIAFHGHVSQDQLKSYLADSDVYVLPSLAEGCASSGLEAMAAGLCVVATRESGLPITDGDTGYIIPLMDAVALADKLEWLAYHPDEVDRIGHSAANLIRNQFTWEHYAENVRNVYKELVQ